MLLLLVGCSAPDTNLAIDNFDKEYRLSDYQEVFSDEDAIIGNITGIIANKDQLIARTDNADYFFAVIDIEHSRVLGQFAARGRAQNEYVSLGRSFSIVDKQLIFMNDANKEIDFISIDSLLVGGHPNMVKYPYSRDFRPMSFAATESNIIFNGAFSNSYIGLKDMNGEIVQNSTEYPYLTPGLDYLTRATTLQTILKSNAYQSKAVVALRGSDLFEIYKISNNTIEREYIYPYKHTPKIEDKGGRASIDESQSIMGISQVELSDKFIFLTFSSINLDQGLSQEAVTNEILCFDWNANKVAKLILPVNINCFTATSNDLFVVSEHNSQVIYRFELPNEIQNR